MGRAPPPSHTHFETWSGGGEGGQLPPSPPGSYAITIFNLEWLEYLHVHYVFPVQNLPINFQPTLSWFQTVSGSNQLYQPLLQSSLSRNKIA